MAIDKLDRKILSIVKHYARKPFRDISTHVGVSRAAVHQRVQNMLHEKVILGSRYDIDPKAVGLNVCVFIGIKLERACMYKQVVEELEKLNEVVECHFVTGHYSALVKVYAVDNEQLMELLITRIQSIEGVVSTETYFSLEQSFKREIPIPGADDWKTQDGL